MKIIPVCTGLVIVLLCAGCGGSPRRLDEVQSTEYLKSREGKELVYPEGIDAPERSSTYDIPPLLPEVVAQDYDINELVRPPDLVNHKTDDKEDEKNKIALAALRAQEKYPRIYVGVGYGSANFEDRYQRSIPYSDTPIAWQAYAGLRLNDYLAVEFAYKQLGDIESGEVPGNGFDRLKISSEFEAFVARMHGFLSLSRWFNWESDFSVFGTAGYFDSEVRRKVVDLSSLETDFISGSDSGLALGGGVLYRFGQISLRGYVELFDVEDIDEVYDMGIAIEFGF